MKQSSRQSTNQGTCEKVAWAEDIGINMTAG